MNSFKWLAAASLTALLAIPLAAHAADAKRGRVYYRMVCTLCHVEKTGAAIAPNGRTRAEWAAYLTADKHAKGKDTVKYYFSKEYRASIKSKNKAAEKYADIPDAELTEDVKVFLIAGAKDSDTPTSCD